LDADWADCYDFMDFFGTLMGLIVVIFADFFLFFDSFCFFISGDQRVSVLISVL